MTMPILKLKQTLICVTPDCTGTIGPGSITGLCPRCYSSIYNWTKRSSLDVITRLTRLKLYEARMSFLIPKKKMKLLIATRNFDQVQLVVLPGQCGQYRKRSKYKKLKAVQ